MEKCEVCGKEFDGENAEKQLRGHMMSHRESREEKEAKPDRVPFGTKERKYSAPADGDGFEYRVFNDNWRHDPGRIARAEKAGYVRVEDSEMHSVGTNDDGSPIKGVLMKIPKEYYEADQKLKQKDLDRVDAAIKGGKLEEGQDDNRYIPNGIKVWGSNSENR